MLFEGLGEAAVEHGEGFGDLHCRDVLERVEVAFHLLEPLDEMADAGDPGDRFCFADDAADDREELVEKGARIALI